MIGKKLVEIIHEVIVEVATCKRPVTAAAVAAVVVLFLPGVNIAATTVAGILVGVGTVAAVVEKLLFTTPPTQIPPTR